MLVVRQRQLKSDREIDNDSGATGKFARWRHNDNIILFVSDKLKKCQQVLSVRVKYKSKYSNIELPTQINKTDGYHRQCYSSFTALMAKYRDSSSETDYASNSTSLTLSPSTPVDISETVLRNVTQSSYSEVASSKDVAPSSNNQSISRHPDLDFNRETSSENAASNLDSQTTLEDVASSSTCDLSINETNVFNEIPDTNIEDIGKERQLKNVCFFCDKDRKQNKDIPHTSWHENRNIHKYIFNHIVSTVEEVLQKKNCVLLSSLCDTYNHYLEYEQKLDPQSDISLITNHYLEEKIQKHFKKSIKFISKQKKKIIIHKDCSLLENDFTRLEEDNLIDKVALTLRNAILKIEKSKLPLKIKTHDLITGECVILDKLNRFFKVLMG
ncbi:Protein of unknown function, partial [Cotesia congregata]